MRAFLWAAIALTFAAGTQLVVLADQTDRYFAWPIEPPMSAVFIGASFWAASAILTWSSRQRIWTKASLPVPSVAVVATLLLIATIQHIDLFEGPLGILWVEVYALVPPLAIGLVVIQLASPGSDPKPDQPMPGGLRLALGAHALILLGAGLYLYAASDDGAAIWPWALSDLTSKAIGTWMLGIGTLAAWAWQRNDRDDLPGASLAYLVLPAMLGLGLVRFSGDVDFGSAESLTFIAFWLSAAAIGAAGALVSLREGRFATGAREGGVPVEIRGPGG